MTNGYDHQLRYIGKLAERRRKLLAELAEAMKGAHASGASYRKIGNAAGVTHETVRSIIRSGT